MARLTDRELGVIQQARGASWREWRALDTLLLEARRNRSELLARMFVRGAKGFVRLTGLSAVTRLVADRVVHPIRKWAMHRRTIAELRQLDDHLLLDIGLCRGDLNHFTEQLIDAKMPAPRKGMLSGLRRALQRRTAIRQLDALDDRLLADIGLVRGDIPRVVDGLLPAPGRSAGFPALAAVTWLAGKLAATAAILGAAIRRRLERRATIRQLEALNDRMLADIGLVRGDIPGFVDGQRNDRSTGAGPLTLEQTNYWDSVVRALRQWDLSRQAANQMARFKADTLHDLGYVKGDVDWVPEVMARRKLDNQRAA